MRHARVLPAAAASSAPHRSLADRARRPTLYAQLSDVDDDFQQMLRDVAGGLRDQRDYDRLEAQAERISAAIRAAFREKAPAHNPPLWQSKDGSRAAW